VKSSKSTSAASALSPTSMIKGKAVELDILSTIPIGNTAPLLPDNPQMNSYSQEYVAGPQSQVHRNSSVAALATAAHSLESSMLALSHNMTNLTNETMALDISSIGLTADAIGKITDALAKVKQLHWSESRVGPV